MPLNVPRTRVLVRLVTTTVPLSFETYVEPTIEPEPPQLSPVPSSLHVTRQYGENAIGRCPRRRIPRSSG